NIIGDYKQWIEYLKNLNEFDMVIKEPDLKQAFEAKKNEYDKQLKEDEIISLKDQLSTNQDKIIELKNEISKLTVNFEQIELDNEDLNNQVNRMKIEIKSKNIKIEKLEQNLENKLFEEQEKSKRLNKEWEKLVTESYELEKNKKLILFIEKNFDEDDDYEDESETNKNDDVEQW
ncbi:3890_t:CDS:2, partial [Racocetra persica]